METDHRNLLAMVLAVAAVLDLLLIPVLRARIQGPSQPIMMLSMLSSSALMMGMAAAFWFGWLPPG